LLLAFLAACQVQSATPAVEPVAGGELILLGVDPPTLDPHYSIDSTSASFIVELFGGLLTLDRDLEIVPDLAQRWELGSDDVTYTFHLNPSARFHDGKVVKAQDFKWSLERATDPATASPSASQYLNDILGFQEKLSGKSDELIGVRVLDDNTLQIVTDAPKSYFPSKLTHPVAFVLDRENVEGDPYWMTDPNGTGPFKLKEYVPRNRMILERNPHYHLGAPHLDSVKLLLGGGSSMLMYENDEVHIVGIGTSVLERVGDPEDPLHDELHTFPGDFNVSYIGMNLGQPPFDDLRVRQAFNYAIDRERIARSILNDSVVLANGVLPPSFPGYDPDLEGYDYDPEKARELLRESIYQPDSFPEVILTVSGDFGGPIRVDTEAMRAMWRDNLGIDVKVQRTQFETFLDDLDRGRLQAFEIGWVADYPDPENFLDNLFHSGSGSNYMGYSNAEVDTLLDRARVERDEDARLDLYREVEEMIVGDAPWIFLWHPGPGHILVKPYVHDYRPAPLIVPVLRYVHMSR
jgi:ABC-type transport system substrate-binding protein